MERLERWREIDARIAAQHFDPGRNGDIESLMGAAIGERRHAGAEEVDKLGAFGRLGIDGQARRHDPLDARQIGRKHPHQMPPARNRGIIGIIELEPDVVEHGQDARR